MINGMNLIGSSTNFIFLLLFVTLSSSLPIFRFERNSLRYSDNNVPLLIRNSRSTGLSEQILAAIPLQKSKKTSSSFFVLGALPNRHNIVIDDNMDDLFA